MTGQRHQLLEVPLRGQGLAPEEPGVATGGEHLDQAVVVAGGTHLVGIALQLVDTCRAAAEGGDEGQQSLGSLDRPAVAGQLGQA